MLLVNVYVVSGMGKIDSGNLKQVQADEFVTNFLVVGK